MTDRDNRHKLINYFFETAPEKSENKSYPLSMISYLNRHKRTAQCVMFVMLTLSRACGVDTVILRHAKKIYQERQVEYALGFVNWFLLYKLRLKLPTYNIYHLIPVDDKNWYLELLREELNDYRVEKQYYLLQSESDIGEEFKTHIKERLELSLQAPRKNTAFKTRKFDTTLAFDALCRIDTILKDRSLKPFLVSGTLLGAIRDNGLIKGDNDLDIGIMADDASSETVFNFLVGNPSFRSVYNLGHLIQVTDNNSTVIDIFIHYREDGQVWHGTTVHKWVNTSFQLSEMELDSHTFLIPDNPRLYLDENYGNWEKPVLFWDYAFDTPNHLFFSNKKAIYYLADRIIGELGKAVPARFTIQTAIDKLNRLFDVDLTRFLGTKSVATQRGKGKVVITFGTFDLFHIGHLKILQRAASYGDRLVVGVSSDALNYSKKGTYPVYCQEDRINIVSAIMGVDDVFFEESLELKKEYIKRYGADILVMGDDWKSKFDYLSDICEVIYLSRTENISTSETKDSIKRNL
jgi:glycerol-3-phosphate cytidylyltransferase